MIGTPPTETNTRAYNGNSVASVYISSGYGDLATKSEVGDGNTSVFDDAALSLQNGFYGMSDPANLRGLVERFEVELTQGGTSKGTYRIRLINPTNELELFLFGIYNAAFPGDNTPFDIYKEASREQEAKTTIKAIDESSPLKDLLSRGMQLPFLYLRWGYGIKEEEGLSRIHKCVLFGCEYFINSNQDKVIELHLIDWFSSLAENQTFNIAPHLTEENCLDKDKQLRGFSKILESLLLKYTEVFPGILPFYDEKSTNMEKLDVVVNNLAVSRWIELQKYLKEDAENKSPNHVATITAIDVATGEEALPFLLEIPSDLAEGRDFSTGSKDLSDANKIWIAAYSNVFDFLQINQRHSSDMGTTLPVFVEVPDIAPIDYRASLGKAFESYKDTTFINTVEIGLLNFLIPVWETPAQKLPFALATPLMSPAVPTGPLQPFETARPINYNPDITMQGEMAGALGANQNPTAAFFQGYLVADAKGKGLEDIGKIGAELMPDAGLVPLQNYKLSYTELEKIILNIRKLEPALSDGQNFGFNSDNFGDLPTAVFTQQSLNRNNPLYAVMSEKYYPLYSPISAGTTIDSRTARNPLWLSTGSFQVKGLESDPDDPSIHEQFPSVRLNNDYNLERFQALAKNANRKHEGNWLPGNYGEANPFMALVPTPDSILKLELIFGQMTQEIIQRATPSTTPALLQTLGDLIPQETTLPDGTVIKGDLLFGSDAREKLDARRDDLEDAYSHSLDVFLGTGKSSTPHITQILIDVVTGINKLVVGEKDPFVVQQVDLNSLTPDGFKELFEPAGLLYSLKLTAEEEDNIWTRKPMLLLIGRSSWLSSSFSDRLLSKIHSFPEITRTEEELQDYIFLSYGEKDSIVTDLKFTGDIRTLYNIPRAFYASLQFNSLKDFFETATQSATEEMLLDMVIFVHKYKDEELLNSLESVIPYETDADEREILLGKRNAIITRHTNFKDRIQAVTYESHQEYLDVFPSLITKFTDEQLTKAGFTNVLAARKVASILGSESFTQKLFPVRKLTAQQFEDLPYGGYTESHNLKTVYYTRQLDVAFFYQTLVSLEAASTDAKMNYVQNAQNEAWQVELTTLGIPEIDVMGAEFFARRIVLSVELPRSEGLHWLSGIYTIVGIKHDLDPSTGFKTNLSLIKVPAATIPAYG